MHDVRVAIVGAGPSGLPAIRHALLYGLTPICFEVDDKVGGLWNYKPSNTEEASVMKSTVINSSKEMTSYSDFPPKPEVANYMHNRKLLEYFNDYADHYDLIKHIRFNHKVTNVKKSKDYEESGKWDVFYTNKEGKSSQETFEAVLICTGHHKFPLWPQPWEGQDKFKGKIIHSHDYKESAGFEDKRIIAVGIGNSGGDIAVELSRVTEQVWLSTRRGSWICSRMFDYGRPADVSINTRFQEYVVRKIVPSSILNKAFESKMNFRFDHQTYGMKPQHDILGAHLTTNDELPNRIISGTVMVKPNIQKLTENGVIFEDGSVVENVDYIICSTGYEIAFPLVEEGKLIKVNNNKVELYKYMYPIDEPFPTLAVLGLVQPLGSIMPVAEMQARVFCAVLTGSAQLPSSDVMRKDVEIKRKLMEKQFYGSPRHTIQVKYMPFMDELATIIGCRPRFLWTFLRDPRLAVKMVFGPCAPYVYRVQGPHTWPGAREAILGLEERIIKGLNPSGKSFVEKHDKSSRKSVILGVPLMLFIVLYWKKQLSQH